MSLVSTSGVVLRTQAYGDTSLIVKALTEEHGVQTFMARGVRARGGKGGAAPELYANGTVTFHHRPGRDMHTLRGFEPERVRRGLAGSMLRFAGAALLAEVVLRHSGTDAQPELLLRIATGLDGIEAAEEQDLPTLVLRECWGLVGALGYRPEVLRCVRCGREFGDEEIGRFDFGLGGVLCADCGAGSPTPRVGPRARAELDDLTGSGGEGALPPDHVRPHFRLLSDFVAYHVSGTQPLPAFGYFLSFLPEAHE